MRPHTRIVGVGLVQVDWQRAVSELKLESRRLMIEVQIDDTFVTKI